MLPLDCTAVLKFLFFPEFYCAYKLTLVFLGLVLILIVGKSESYFLGFYDVTKVDF